MTPENTNSNARASHAFLNITRSVDEIIANPGDTPVAIYFELAALAVERSGVLGTSATDQDFSAFAGNMDVLAAEREAKAALAYRIAYKSFCSDTVHNDTVQGDLLMSYVTSRQPEE